MKKTWHKSMRAGGFMLMNTLSDSAWNLWTKLAYCTEPYDNHLYNPINGKLMGIKDIASFWQKSYRHTRRIVDELVASGVLEEEEAAGGITYVLHTEAAFMGKGNPDSKILKSGKSKGQLSVVRK